MTDRPKAQNCLEPPTQVVLANPDGSTRGLMDKLAAHQAPGHLHLAFSVLVFDFEGKVLLQKRAKGKYHFPSVWANACCSHPRPGEEISAAAVRRMREELGIVIPLEPVGNFIYRARCATSGLVEHEVDHVFVGQLDHSDIAKLHPDPKEVDCLEFVDAELLLLDGNQAHASDWILGSRTMAPWLAPALLLAKRHGFPKVVSSR